MRNPFTVFRRCRELEAQVEKLTAELSEITAMRSDYPGIEPCKSPRCKKCEYAIARDHYNPDGSLRLQLVGCAVHAKCEDFKPSRFYYDE